MYIYIVHYCRYFSACCLCVVWLIHLHLYSKKHSEDAVLFFFFLLHHYSKCRCTRFFLIQNDSLKMTHFELS